MTRNSKHYASRFIYLILALILACAPAVAGSKSASEPPLVGTVMFSTSSHRGDKLDINSASKHQLAALPGMAAYADKIVAGRPYTTKLDLVKRGIVSQAIYDKVKNRIIAHRVSSKKTSSAKYRSSKP